MHDDPENTTRSAGSEGAEDTSSHVADMVRDALDIVVGLGIMAVNRVQSVRREMARNDADRASTDRDD